MSALSIQPPFPIFTETDGQPLENGYIWLGTINLNPIVNPITAYWDAALTIAAVQPIRTLNGYPVYQGTPARIYVNSDYSIQVQNRNGSVVYSAPAATERYGGIINANDVVYDPAGTGAVATTVQAKLRESVSIEDFGAIADNDSQASANVTAIQAALNSGAKTVRIPSNGVFAYNNEIIVPSGVTLFGGEMKPTANAAIVRMTGSDSTVTNVTFRSTLSNTLYSVAQNGVQGLFSSSSVLTDAAFTPVGTLGAGKISGNNLTLGLFSDTGNSQTRVLSSKISINSAKRYVVDIADGFVVSGHMAARVEFRAYDSAGALIVGNSSITVDANGVYEYILPATYTLGNYLWLDNASFIEVSLSVVRETQQGTGNTCVFDMSKISVYELVNDAATLTKISHDDYFPVSAEGTNNTISYCTFKNLATGSARARNSVGAKLIGNYSVNCLAGFNTSFTTGTVIDKNVTIADFGGMGQRLFRYKGTAGIGNAYMDVTHNISWGFFWGFELITYLTNLSNPGCTISFNSVYSISSPYSLAGYSNSSITHNEGRCGQLGHFLMEFPGELQNCNISNNTLISTSQAAQVVGMSACGMSASYPNNTISNNTIVSTVGITLIIGSPNDVNQYQGTVVANNTIHYMATGIFSNCGGIDFDGNTLTCYATGSNVSFGQRTAMYVFGNAYAYYANIRNNTITDIDSYALSGTNTRSLTIVGNTINHNESSCAAINYGAFPSIVTIFRCVGNTILTSYPTTAITITGAYVTNSVYVINNNWTEDGATIQPSVAFTTTIGGVVNRGTDQIKVSDTTSSASLSYSVTLGPVPAGSYLITMLVHNGDKNHAIKTQYSLLYSKASINTLSSLSSINTASCGTIIATAALSISGTDLVCSGTTTVAATVYYSITIVPV